MIIETRDEQHRIDPDAIVDIMRDMGQDRAREAQLAALDATVRKRAEMTVKAREMRVGDCIKLRGWFYRINRITR